MSPASPVGAPHDPYAPLRVLNFRWFVASVLTMAMSAQIQGVVVGWQLYALTHNPLTLAMVGLAEAAPFVLCSLYAGHIADVRDRRRVALQALVVLFACALALAAVSALLIERGRSGVAVQLAVYVVIAMCGLARSFLLPARSALGADLVPRALFPSAVAWRTGVWQVAAVIGPALGGLLYAWIGPTRSLAVSAGLMATAVLTVLRIRVAPRPTVARREAVVASVLEGLKFLRQRRLFMGAITLDLFAVLFGGVTAILPVFADDVLHVGPQGLGALRAAPAIGAVLMSAAIALRTPPRRAGRTFLYAVVLFGVFTIGFGLSHSFLLSLALLAASGAADMLSVYFRATLMQVMVPSTMLGRVSAVNQIFIGSSNELGAFESGLAAWAVGAVPSVVIGGAITIAVTLIAAWRVPEIARLDRLEGHDPDAGAPDNSIRDPQRVPNPPR